MAFETRIKTPRFKSENGFLTTPDRSKLMSRIRSKDTVPEIALRKALWRAGVRFRLRGKALKGKPDIVIKSKMVVVFVDGDFWHGKNWPAKKEKIKSNREFWIAKIERNIQRDRETTAALQLDGWRVIRIWESDIKKDLSASVNRVLSIL